MTSVQKRLNTLLAAAIATAGLVIVPAGPAATALPCPAGSLTCGPTVPTLDPNPGGNNGGITTAPQAPTTTIPGATPDTGLPQAPTQTTTPDNFHVQTPDFGTPGPNDCILNCDAGGPTQAPTTAPRQQNQDRPQAPSQEVTTPSPPSPPPTSTAGPSDRQEICAANGVGSSLRNGKVAIDNRGVDPALLADAVDTWNRGLPGEPFSAASNPEKPSLVVDQIDDASVPWPGQ